MLTQNKTAVEKQKVKRCPCKKIFEKTLGLTPEQIKLADKNRVDEKKEIKAVNKKIKKLKSKKQSEKNMKKIADLKQKKLEIKAKHNEIFESYLTDEQKAKLQQMLEDKKNGKSCCPCRKKSVLLNNIKIFSLQNPCFKKTGILAKRLVA